MKRFGVMLDMSRNAVMKPAEIINFAKIIKSMGYNMIQLYTEDTYQVENEPYFGYLRGRYTFDEQKYIVDECEKIGVEVIPCIQTLAHLNQIFKWEKYNNMRDTQDILLAEDQRTYTLIDNMFKTLKKSFKSKYVHIGMDEAHMLGLGKYLDIHGYNNRFEILLNHLKKVIEIAKKYGFKPIMWSDMFFRLANGGNYYADDLKVSQYAIDNTPEDVDLVYWDYYHSAKETYDKMFAAHKKFKNNLWFAGGAWTWCGFAPGNYMTINKMYPAMLSAKENGTENILMTMWGDNGAECSFYSLLPSLFAVRKFYDGITDMNVIASEFNQLTGENFNDMMNLDLPNCINGNKFCIYNVSKYMLYSDIFNGVLDTAVTDNGADEFKRNRDILIEASKNSKNYKYIFDELASLCDVLTLKYDFGVRLRNAYHEKDFNKLKTLSSEIDVIIEKINIFYDKFSYLWYKENKPEGFDVQDIRLGGLLKRLSACKARLDKFIDGKIENIPELEGELLHYSGNENPEKSDEMPSSNIWSNIVTPNVI